MQLPEERKQLSRRDFLRVSGVAATALLVAACVAPSAVPSGQSGAAAPAKAPATIQANFAFTQSDYGLQYEVIGKWRDLFQQTYPWITVKLAFVDWEEHHKKMLVLAAANQLPDFVEVQASRSQLCIVNKVFLPVDDYIAADTKFKMDDFFPGIMEYYQREKKTYALPYDHGPEILGYNKTLFDEKGVHIRMRVGPLICSAKKRCSLPRKARPGASAACRAAGSLNHHI